jgi:hypothetical protein
MAIALGALVALTWGSRSALPDAAPSIDRTAVAVGDDPHRATAPQTVERAEVAPSSNAERKSPGVNPEPGARAKPQATAPPLPPADRPLAKVFDELAQRAREGDRDAACRLAWDLETCAGLDELTQVESTLVDWAAQERSGSPDESRAARRVAALSARLARARSVCAGLKASQTALASSMMRRAAELGEPRSMARYALYPRFDPQRPLDEVDAMLAYREDAPGFLVRAVDAGDPLALAGLYHALVRGQLVTRAGSVPIDADAVRALELGLVLRSIADAATVRGINDDIARILPRLTATQREQAERAAAQRLAGPFRNATPRNFIDGWLEPELARVCAP